MISRGFSNFVCATACHNRFAEEVEHQTIERLEAICVFEIIAEQNVLLDEEQIVAPAVDERDTVGEHFICSFLLVAE